MGGLRRVVSYPGSKVRKVDEDPSKRTLTEYENSSRVRKLSLKTSRSIPNYLHYIGFISAFPHSTRNLESFSHKLNPTFTHYVSTRVT